MILVLLTFSLGDSVCIFCSQKSVSSEQISCVHFFFHIVKYRVIAIGYDAATHYFEFLQIIYDQTSEESGAVF